jgi:membrane-associated phospholipid phosphatase
VDASRDEVAAPGDLPRRERAWPLIAFAAACIGLGYAFFSFGSEVAERETGTFDRAVRDWVLLHQNPAARTILGTVTWLGSSLLLGPATLLLGVLLVRRGARRRPLLLAVTPLVFWLFVTLLKYGYHITRPATGVAERLGFSFPSGHASMGMAAAVVFSYVLVRERMASRVTLLIGPLLAIFVGLTRVYLDVHWASDVIGGWAIGAAYGAACCALYAWAHRRAVQVNPQLPDRAR